ncbi:MAG: SUMF1/EgtB/PvdO family nonheme iron enzyme [Pseudomonadota bacterium]
MKMVRGAFEKIKERIQGLSETLDWAFSGQKLVGGEIRGTDFGVEEEVAGEDLEEFEEALGEEVLEVVESLDEAGEADEIEGDEFVEEEIVEPDPDEDLEIVYEIEKGEEDCGEEMDASEVAALKEMEEEVAPEDLEEIEEAVEEEDLEEVEVPEVEDGIAEIDEEPFVDDMAAGLGSAESAEVDFPGYEAGDDAGVGHPDEDLENPDEARKARLLAEQFNRYLGAMDQYFNQYLLIPKGVYIVGGGQVGTNKNPEKSVRLTDYYFGKFPVTNALFEIFVDKTGYVTTAERLGFGNVYFPRSQRRVDEKTGKDILIWNSSLKLQEVQGACWYQPLGPGSSLHHKRSNPVVQVSLEDAMAFAAWTGKRLPTEEEWEAAARTEKGHCYPWGNDLKKGACNIEEIEAGDTTPVDRFIDFENDLGIVDTMGNVWEWALGRPGPEGQAFKGESACFVIKGGGWTSRNGLSLLSRETLDRKSRSNVLGFRCVAI